MKEEIGKRILELRKSMNLNKEQFAKLIGISGQYLGTVEAGVNGLSLTSLMNLCTKTNTSADYILFGKRGLSDENLINVFDKIEKSQIVPAFEVLESIALFIKAYGTQKREENGF